MNSLQLKPEHKYSKCSIKLINEKLYPPQPKTWQRYFPSPQNPFLKVLDYSHSHRMSSWNFLPHLTAENSLAASSVQYSGVWRSSSFFFGQVLCIPRSVMNGLKFLTLPSASNLPSSKWTTSMCHPTQSFRSPSASASSLGKCSAEVLPEVFNMVEKVKTKTEPSTSH